MLVHKEWRTDFQENGIDPHVWNHEIGYIRNHELQYYTDSALNSYVENGELVIRALKLSDKNCPYTSASLNTMGKVEFLYGTLEMTAKLPYGTGIWPAFWTLGADFPTVGWPFCGEIDIMEMLGGVGHTHRGGGDYELFSTLHFPGEETYLSENHSVVMLTSSERLCDGYHRYGMKWDEESIQFMFDGEVWAEWDIRSIESFHKPHFLLVNIAVGGDWPGDPDENTVFPQEYRIREIRYIPRNHHS